jgi:hypothetical protein
LELVYTGTYTEETLVPGVQFQRTYRLESTLLVLDAVAGHWDVAVLTALRLQNGRKEADDKSPQSVRLEIAQVDKNGNWTSKASALRIPLEGPPTLETGAIMPLPMFHDKYGETPEAGRPPRAWQMVGSESCSGATCYRLLGQQQSDDWDRPRADHTAWRRHDTLWLGPQLGVAYRVERVIERREPARTAPTSRTIVRYELDSRVRYPGKMFDDRRNEILKALKFHDEAALLWSEPARYAVHIDALLQKIAFYVKYNPSSVPYRKATLNTQARLESARRGEAFPEGTPAGASEEPAPAAQTVRIGQRVPDVIATNLLDRQSTRLYRLLGRPILIVFYNPATNTGKHVLLYTKDLAVRYRENLGVLAMAVGPAELARRQHADLRLPFPIHDGQGLHLTFGVEATPRFVVLDREGVVHAATTGWGRQTPREIEEALQDCLPK